MFLKLSVGVLNSNLGPVISTSLIAVCAVYNWSGPKIDEKKKKTVVGG